MSRDKKKPLAGSEHGGSDHTEHPRAAANGPCRRKHGGKVVNYSQSPQDVPHYRELGEVSRALATGYARLAERGIPPEMVTVAMLNATVNVFSMFEKRTELPSLLRELADTIENEPRCLQADANTRLPAFPTSRTQWD